MIKGIYSAFSALEAAWKFQDVLANNISNANTIGYKRETVLHESFSDVLLTQTSQNPTPLANNSRSVLGSIGTGTYVAGSATDFTNGELQPTGNALDFAVDKGFFAIQTADGQTYYTRDGRFTRDATGDLVTGVGDHVLDVNGNPVNVPSEDIAISADGVITANGQQAGQLMVVSFGPTDLQRAGASYFTSAVPGTQIAGQVHQGFLEGSNSSLTTEMTSLLAAQRTFEANQTILARLDETLNEAAGQLGLFVRQ